jgi:hypothetical protein
MKVDSVCPSAARQVWRKRAVEVASPSRVLAFGRDTPSPRAVLEPEQLAWELLTTCACRLPLRKRSPRLRGIMDHQDQ